MNAGSKGGIKIAVVIIESTNPLHGRQQFKSRTFLNVVIITILFLLTVAIFSALISRLFTSALLPTLVCDALALGGAYYLYLLWDKRPIRLCCSHCHKVILSNTPWVCGFCKKENGNPNEHSFLDKCGHCGAEPKTYRCHHSKCGKLIFLTDDCHEEGYAYALNSPSEKPKTDELEEKIKQHQAIKLTKQEEFEIAKLDAKLKALKEHIEGPKVKTPLEQKKDLFENAYAGAMGLKEIARQKRAQVAVELKDHPELLKQANEAIDDIEARYS